MDINPGYIAGAAAIVFFGLGYLWSGHIIKWQEFPESAAGQFARRLAQRIDEIDKVAPGMRYFAVCPDGEIMASPYPLYINPHGWDDDREHYIVGIDAEAAKHWRDSQVTRKQVSRMRRAIS